jgi:hypothetical protein
MCEMELYDKDKNALWLMFWIWNYLNGKNTINSPQSFTTFSILHLIFQNLHHSLRYIAGWNESRSNWTLPGVWILIFSVVYCFLHWLCLTEGKTEKLVTKKSHAEHVMPFLSERTEITNGFVTTKNLETLLVGHIANF